MAITLLLLSVAASCAARATEDARHSVSRSRAVQNSHIFNPRMDYDEWTPLGRGDPLKNDPTYDYVPPVLERVHYWMDPSKRTPDPPLPNSDITVTPRTDLAPTTPLASSRFDTMTLLDPFLKFMDASKATLGYSTHLSSYFRPTSTPGTFTHPIPLIHPPVYGAPPPSRVQSLQRPPYTMLIPPPLPPSTEIILTSFGTSTSSTTSKSTEETVTEYSPILSTSEPITDTTTVISSTTTSSPTTNLANSENLYKPVAINMPEAISNATDEYMSSSHEGAIEEQSFQQPFQGATNHLRDLKTPSLVMIPPLQSSDDYYGFRPTTVRTTTAVTTLTTDSIFKHYKQPSEPMRGPFYLIIQGHSKVKTYGASRNKVKAVSSNEINFEDGKVRDDDDLTSSESYRRDRKLRFKDTEYLIDDENADIVQGHPVIELTASYKSKGLASFSVSDNDADLDSLEEAFPKSIGGSSKKRVLKSDHLNGTSSRKRRFISRRILATDTSANPTKVSNKLDQEQLGLENLIALNDDYNSEDVINLLLKEEGQGSGLGNFVSSIFSRSKKQQEEI